MVYLKQTSVTNLTYYTLLTYNDVLELAYDEFNIPNRLNIYIDDNKVIQDYVLSYHYITHTAPNNYDYDKSDLFLIRV